MSAEDHTGKKCVEKNDRSWQIINDEKNINIKLKRAILFCNVGALKTALGSNVLEKMIEIRKKLTDGH